MICLCVAIDYMFLSKNTKKTFFIRLVLTLSWLLPIVFITGSVYILNRPPKNFPLNQQITIDSGVGAKRVSDLLKDKGFIKSNFLLYYILLIFNDPSNIKASTYVFEEPQTTTQIARKLMNGDFSNDLVKLTHPEGERVEQLAKRTKELLPDFNADIFIDKAKKFEGRLFPDTYFIPPSYSEQELIDLMLETFKDKITPLLADIEKSYLTLDKIIILASIIEREADSRESKRMVSAILQNRLKANMPLQADASIEYILDKPLSELTPEDLKIDSPYNTYLNLGLPPTAIGNPGLETIEAVLYPAETDYMFYLTDGNGDFYYAKTYKEHKANIEKYLK